MALSETAVERAGAGRRLRSQSIGWVVTTLVLVVVFALFIPRIVDYADVWFWIGKVGPGGLIVLLLAVAANQASYPSITMSIIPGVRYREALVARLASTAVSNVLPGGGAAGVAVTSRLLSSWGVTGGSIGRFVVLSGLATNGIRLVLPVAALAMLVLSGRSAETMLQAATIGTAALIVAVVVLVFLFQAGFLARIAERLVERVMRLFRREPLLSADLRSGIREAVGPEALAVLGRRWPALVGAVLLNELTLFFTLLVSLRLVGVSAALIHWSEALAAFALIRLVSIVPLTPGGIGIAEAGYTALLASGMSETVSERVVAAVLLFRFVSYVLPVPLGAGSGLVWRLRTDWRRSADARRRQAAMARFGIDAAPEWLEEASCFRCDLPGRELHRMEPFAVVRCPRCRQTFVSPRLNAAGRLALYDDPAYFEDGVYRTSPASFLQRTWGRGRLDIIMETLDGRGVGRLFEIGCAYGTFLEAARERGFDVGGLEFSPVAARTAASRLGCEIEIGEVEHLADPSRADVVVFWDVLEHVPDPSSFLAAAAELVEPGGLLALSCPYLDSIPARLLRSHWWTLKPHKHIWHFTREGLLGLLRQHGLEPVRVVRNPAHAANLSRLDSLVVVAGKGAHSSAAPRRGAGAAGRA